MKVLYVIRDKDTFELIDMVVINGDSYSECEGKFITYTANPDVELPSVISLEKFVISFVREI